MLYLYRSKKKKNTFDAKTRCAVSIVSNLIPVAVVQFLICVANCQVANSTCVKGACSDDRGFLCHDYGQEMIVSPETKIVVLTENSIKKNRHII